MHFRYVLQEAGDMHPRSVSTSIFQVHAVIRAFEKENKRLARACVDGWVRVCFFCLACIFAFLHVAIQRYTSKSQTKNKRASHKQIS